MNGETSDAEVVANSGSLFDQLDFIYTPSNDVAGDVAYFVEILGARLVFAIEAEATRVAMVDLSSGSPKVLFADHLAGERPVLVYRVADLGEATAELTARGWERQPQFEIPPGPCCLFDSPGGHRLAIYKLTRPEAIDHFQGRQDF